MRLSIRGSRYQLCSIFQQERSPARGAQRRCGARNGPAIFAALKPWLNGAATAPQSEVALALDVSEAAVKVAIHRLRGRLRELIRAEIATTVNDPADIADELRHLIAVAGSS